jgi:hypothetical protein
MALKLKVKAKDFHVGQSKAEVKALSFQRRVRKEAC